MSIKKGERVKKNDLILLLNSILVKTEIDLRIVANRFENFLKPIPYINIYIISKDIIYSESGLRR
jgi:hypothetical protein